MTVAACFNKQRELVSRHHPPLSTSFSISRLHLRTHRPFSSDHPASLSSECCCCQRRPSRSYLASAPSTYSSSLPQWRPRLINQERHLSVPLISDSTSIIASALRPVRRHDHPQWLAKRNVQSSWYEPDIAVFALLSLARPLSLSSLFRTRCNRLRHRGFSGRTTWVVL